MFNCRPGAYVSTFRLFTTMVQLLLLFQFHAVVSIWEHSEGVASAVLRHRARSEAMKHINKKNCVCMHTDPTMRRDALELTTSNKLNALEDNTWFYLN